MKIENYDISMASKHEVLRKKSEDSFAKEWEAGIQTSKSREKKETLCDVVQKIKVELINELLASFKANKPEPQSSQTSLAYFEHTEHTKLEFKRLGIPIEYVKSIEKHEYKESLQTSTKGIIKTADGREISIDVNLKLAQSFCQKIETQKAVFTDPLVINLEGRLPELEDTKFSFDIDSDGESEQISRLSKGSGFLALDKNGNGKIDDGSELFGTKSGNGFADLSAYDSDKNGWIDESDDVFDKLRIWTDSEEGSKLIALGEAGVGAIYLGSSEAGYMYKNQDGKTLGALRESGMFLFESGKTGTISQIDFTTDSKESELQKLLRGS